MTERVCVLVPSAIERNRVRFIAQGVEPRAIMEILGHSQISMTRDLYSHIYPQMRRDVADRMEAVFKVG